MVRQTDSSSQDQNANIIKVLSHRFRLAALLLLVSLGVDLPWFGKQTFFILLIRGGLIIGSLIFSFLGNFCRTRSSAETLVFIGILIQVNGLACLGLVEGTYLIGYTSALYQTLAFITVFFPLRTWVFASLITAIGIFWFLIFPTLNHLSFDPRLFFSHVAAYLTSGFISLAGNHLFFRLRVEEGRQRAKLESQARHLQELATRDGLTGVFNFRHFQDLLSILVEDAKRDNRSLSLCLIDLDDFKSINDEEGHVAGNNILKHVAHCLLSVVRHDDLVFRIGGDEFAIILPDLRVNETKVIAGRIQTNINAGKRPSHEQSKEIRRPIQCSIGIAELSSRFHNASALIEAADRALYRAKKEGSHIVIEE